MVVWGNQLRTDDDISYLWREQTRNRHAGRETNGYRHARYAQRHMVCSAEI